MSALIAVLVALWPSVAAALPGAEPGDECDAYLTALRARGAEIDDSLGDPSYFVRDPEGDPPSQAAYWCENGTITRQILILGFAAERQARNHYLEIRDELERALGKAMYDDTNARDRQEFAERSRLFGTKSDPDLMSGAIMWESGWNLSIEEFTSEFGAWRVTISFNPPARRITSP
ncbi:MAG: hypothetical protein NXI18_21910 [Alphaproteobacteria bacterium]|nr:hypothetical protein [Alphaproteobacteria bacterium]